jgi:Ca2+-binding EF-hand superfamily protein
MLFGYPPFYADQDKYGAETDERIFQLIQHGFEPVTKAGYGPHFPEAIPCSDSAKDLISKLLVSDTAKRYTAAETLEHPWLTGHTASDTPILTNVLNNLRNFQNKNKFKQAVLNLMSSSLSEDEVEQLKKTFRDMDEDGDGTVTQAELKKALAKAGDDSKSAQDLADIMAMADLDGDGKLSYNELLLTCVQKRLAAKEERVWQAFCKLDLNGDGKVSREELSMALGGVANSEALALIQEVDVDGDGMVSYDEFVRMWQNKEDEIASLKAAQVNTSALNMTAQTA